MTRVHNLPGKSLSERELEVVRGLANGLDRNQIAEHLHLSIYTVKSHLARISVKTGKHTQAGIVGFAFRNGYLT